MLRLGEVEGQDMIIALISSHSPGCTEPSGGRPPGVPAEDNVIEINNDRHNEKKRTMMETIEDLMGRKASVYCFIILIVAPHNVFDGTNLW